MSEVDNSKECGGVSESIRGAQITSIPPEGDRPRMDEWFHSIALSNVSYYDFLE
ncbi:MAG: hypothetical protein ACFFER_06025 [Candidatus Thorarchaeota archaeon]